MSKKPICDCNQGRMPCTCKPAQPSAPAERGVVLPDGWEESLNTALVLETERAMRQRDEYLKTGVSTAGHGGSHDTCFAAIVRQHIAPLNPAPAEQQPAAVGVPDLASDIVNDCCWAFIEAMPHNLPGPIWNDLKPALYEALKKYHVDVLAAPAPVRQAEHDFAGVMIGGVLYARECRDCGFVFIPKEPDNDSENKRAGTCLAQGSSAEACPTGADSSDGIGGYAVARQDVSSLGADSVAQQAEQKPVAQWQLKAGEDWVNIREEVVADTKRSGGTVRMLFAEPQILPDGRPDAIDYILSNLALQCAVACDERHSYLPASTKEDWQPHKWVCDAMRAAVSADRLYNWPAAPQPAPSPAAKLVGVPVELLDEAERCLFVLREIGSMDAEDISGDDVDLRFEDANGRDTGADVSIVEYAERAANLIAALLATDTAQQQEGEA